MHALGKQSCVPPPLPPLLLLPPLRSFPGSDAQKSVCPLNPDYCCCSVLVFVGLVRSLAWLVLSPVSVRVRVHFKHPTLAAANAAGRRRWPPPPPLLLLLRFGLVHPCVACFEKNKNAGFHGGEAEAAPAGFHDVALLRGVRLGPPPHRPQPQPERPRHVSRVESIRFDSKTCLRALKRLFRLLSIET